MHVFVRESKEKNPTFTTVKTPERKGTVEILLAKGLSWQGANVDDSEESLFRSSAKISEARRDPQSTP